MNKPPKVALDDPLMETREAILDYQHEPAQKAMNFFQEKELV